MAPKKKEQQKMSLGDFLTADSGFGGSWADEVEETYVTGTQALPPSDRPRPGGGASAEWQNRGFSSVRENIPAQLPDKPPYTAHLGNLSYDATVETVTEFFEGCEIVSVRIIEDREMQRPKGFGYVEFTELDGLKQALTLDGQSFQGRMIKIKVADPPRGGNESRMDSSRDLSDWTRKGPLPDLPGARNNRQNDFGGERERRPRDPALDPRPAREINWERRGPLPPLEGENAPRDGSRTRGPPDGMGDRSSSFRGPRGGAGANWGEGRPEGGPAGPKPERAERVASAAEKDFQWRDRMRPEAAAKGPEGAGQESPVDSPASPAAPSRPRLNLQKRTVPDAGDASATTPSDSKASPFGAARPIDTATREKEVEEKRQQAIQEKREAEEKAKEEKRAAKAAAAAAESKEGEEPKENAEGAETPAAAEGGAEGAEAQEGEQKLPVRTREPREPREPKSRAAETGNWRSASGDQRGPRGPGGNTRGGRGGARGGRRDDTRGPRSNGAPAQQPAAAGAAPAAPAASGDKEGEVTVDEDGWTTVTMPKKGGRGRP
ncbi:hypothetical protein VHEMI06402 [[Torrubiella] hemipterigena]|uniref:RRM domain-containing protein n=1 Tax=[Torrubiella] hemipterigena TaxID=1531966 RepID=A0A0A1T764_9HYPO|nr:hypothetical protein VHEMI06402 [[Torrubiella] hemipterigena]